ncbi:alpha/beta hydrolase [Actinoplanes solisilvae]|uniref:alpha/beta hydrolase n=1 Tax=Actinoplanes solisilvae TaxID=2486853 RepID=UPI000FD91F7D|nr:alpha/beta hydrolase [Actinoplanes solisilvae]
MEFSGVAAGVPYVVSPPAGGARSDAPVVVGYHLLDAPRTEVAFAAALPLDGLDAWRVYLGLPMSGSRLPETDIWQLVLEDAVLNVHRHVVLGALDEFPAAFAAIRERFEIDADVPIGLLGGSMGAAAAQLVAAEGRPVARVAVLVNPVVRLRDSINAIAAAHDAKYHWTPPSNQIAARLDFLARAADLDGVALRYITGASDSYDGFIGPVEKIVAELAGRGATVDHQVVPDMAHALADEPGIEAAPQTPQAREVDRLAVEWFRREFSS